MAESGASGVKYVYACGACGVTFYVDAGERPGIEPVCGEGGVPCAQCGEPETRLTFTLGAQCERPEC